MSENRGPVFIIAGICLYLAATALSFLFFKHIAFGKSAPIAPSVDSSASGSGTPKTRKTDLSQPKTEVCPLNGLKYTKAEKDIWETRRPLAVMIENHEEARPQSGLSSADIIYEAVAEGGITRFMGVYYCGTAGGNITLAPVRSARTYFVDWVSEYDALYNHVGGAGRCNDPTVDERAKALCQIERYGIKDMDQFGIGFPNCYRNYDRLDHPVATEHTMVCESDKLYSIAQSRGFTNKDKTGKTWDSEFSAWKFAKEAAKIKDSRPETFSLAFRFWEGYDKYAVKWDYDKSANVYKRSTGGAPQIDLNNSKPLTAANVVLQFVKETDGVDEHAHILLGTTGAGKMMLFQEGKVINGTWSKAKRTDRTKYFDNSGKEVEFIPGQIWVEAVSNTTKADYTK